MTAATRSAGVLAVAFLLLHLPFLPPSLEDLDSVNFALGIRDFDVTRHQPHPPGYPLYILAAKLVHVIVRDEARALAVLSVVCGSLAIFGLGQWFRRIEPKGVPEDWVAIGLAVTMTTPLFWFTAVRPLSDMPGLAAVIGLQALILAATTPSRLTVAAFAAALAAGIRSQVWWLTVPLMALAVVRLPAHERLKAAVRSGAAFAAGTLVWFVPLVLITGGPSMYLEALATQGGEDFNAEGVMVWVTRTPRQLLIALTSAFIAPWATPYLAIPMLCFVALGTLVVLFRSWRAAVTLAVAFGPYLVFDLLFQESVTTRYALPLVIPLGYLATRGVAALPRQAGLVAAGVLIAASVWPGMRDLKAYASQEPPGFRLLDDMTAAVPREASQGFVLALHRREEFELRRPFVWDQDAPKALERLAAPPKREWLEVVNYWNRGGRAPVWFMADPLRNDLALFDHRGPRGRYRWPMSYPLLIGGVRPNVVDWYVLDRPGWYLGRGWAVTPETAGVAREDGQAPGRAPIQGWLRRRPEPVTVVFGGRNLSGTVAHVRLSMDGRVLDEADVNPGFFLRMFTAQTTGGSGDYAELTVDATGDVAIEQFDAQSPDRVVFGYDEGWHEAEYLPLTGLTWRWMSERATLRVRGTGHPSVLRIRGVTEEFSKPSQVTIRSGDRVFGRFEAGETFDIRASVPADAMGVSDGTIVVETDQVYIPAEKRSGSQDRRHLALKVYACEFLPVR